MARLIGAEADEVAFVENATRAWDLAFYSLDFKPGDRILTCVSEYSSNYISYLQVAKKTGAEIVVVPDDNYGQIDLGALERAIDKRTKLVSISHVPTQGGLVQPAEAVGKIANDAGVLYLLDACQSVGQMPVDVRKIGCDFLSMTGRKYLRGPRGTGFLYAKRATTRHIEPLLLDNHAAKWTDDNAYTVRDDARRFENWERYFAGVIGLKVAADQANELGMEPIWARLRELADGLRTRLSTVKGVTLTDLGKVKGAIVTFAVAGTDHNELKAKLREQAINVIGLHAVLLAPRSQGPRPAERHARLGACLQHRGRTGSLRGCAGGDHLKGEGRPWPSISTRRGIASTYTGRQADAGWVEAIRRIVDPAGKRVADIGCGGGIYSRAWHALGAEVVGVDFSEQMVAAAREQAAGLSPDLLPAGRCRGNRPAGGQQERRLRTGADPSSQGLQGVLHRSPPRARPGRQPDRAGPHAGRCPTARLARACSRLFLRMFPAAAGRRDWPAARPMRPSAMPCRPRVFATSTASRFGKCARPMTTGKG